ncbi:MAG: hypothetical protein ACOY32_06130 [Thermodesulfobacteriota bacterium]
MQPLFYLINEVKAMSKREAIRILMLSPIYFRLSLLQRQELLAEFMQMHAYPRIKTGQSAV